MKTRRIVLTTAIVLAVLDMCASGVFAADMFSGTWKLNAATSSSIARPVPQVMTQTIKAIPNGLRFAEDGQCARAENALEWTTTFDDKEDQGENATLTASILSPAIVTSKCAA